MVAPSGQPGDVGSIDSPASGLPADGSPGGPDHADPGPPRWKSWFSDWDVADAQTRRVMGLFLGLFALFDVTQVFRYVREPGALYPDFFGFWSLARFLASHAPAQLYDNPVLAAFQRQLDPGFAASFPCLYPPSFLLLLWPFGQMSYGVARVTWLSISLLVFLFAVCGTRWRRPVALAAALVPATTVCLIYGQNGLLSAALMIGGVRLARGRPALAGILFGVLIYKPQLGVLIPLALAAAGLWRAIATAAATVVVLVAGSAAAFGWEMWRAWPDALRAFSHLGGSDRVHLDALSPTVSAAVRQLGGSGMEVAFIQLVATALAAAVVWRCWRRGSGLAGDLTLPVATILATPYAYSYDLPMVAATGLLALQDWGAKRGEFRFVDLIVVLMTLMLPTLFVSSWLHLAAPAVAVLALLLWRLACNANLLRPQSTASLA
jgi:hypothetical protein